MGKESPTISRRNFLQFAGKTAAVSRLSSPAAHRPRCAGGKIRRQTSSRYRHSSSLLSAGTHRRD